MWMRPVMQQVTSSHTRVSVACDATVVGVLFEYECRDKEEQVASSTEHAAR